MDGVVHSGLAGHLDGSADSYPAAPAFAAGYAERALAPRSRLVRSRALRRRTRRHRRGPDRRESLRPHTLASRTPPPLGHRRIAGGRHRPPTHRVGAGTAVRRSRLGRRLSLGGHRLCRADGPHRRPTGLTAGNGIGIGELGPGCRHRRRRRCSRAPGPWTRCLLCAPGCDHHRRRGGHRVPPARSRSGPPEDPRPA